MKKVSGAFHAIVVVCVVFVLCLTSPVSAWADLTLSGSQTRGMGTDGKLRCSGLQLPQGGVILSASDAGAGLWLQGPNGQVLRFTPASKAVGAQLSAGVWYVYPNLPAKENTAGASVTIQASGAGMDGTYGGTWGEQGKLVLTVKKGAVSGVLSGTDNEGTVISVNISGTIDVRGTIHATTQGTIRSKGQSIATGGAFTGKLANGSGSGSWNFTMQGVGAEPTPWKARK